MASPLTHCRATEPSLNVLTHAHPSYMVGGNDLPSYVRDTFIAFHDSVSRPLFVEEHGLRLLLEREGVGVEMTRDAYEAGEWAGAVSEAWGAGAQRKLERRAGKHAQDRCAQGLQMARDVVTWVTEWAAASNSTKHTLDLEVR
jgi:hypothetical protein